MEDDVDSNSDGDVDGIEAEEGDRERFDRELPGRHDYLGEGREVRGVGEVEDLVSLPLFSQMHLSLMPGQTLPLHLFHPSLVSMMRTVLASPSKAFGVISLGVDKEKWAGTVGTTAHVYEVRESEEVPVGSPQVLKLQRDSSVLAAHLMESNHTRVSGAGGGWTEAEGKREAEIPTGFSKEAK